MTNKIHKYNFLVVGAGLIGSLAALNLLQKGYNVLIIDKNIKSPRDTRTLAVNANSKDFLVKLGLWKKLVNKPQCIQKIIIKDIENKEELFFENKSEEMGNVIFNNELLSLTRKELKKYKSLKQIDDLEFSKLIPEKIILFNKKKYLFNKIILSIGKKFSDEILINRYSIYNNHHAYVGFFDHSLFHHNTAYELFRLEGPLAVLPSPGKRNKLSTFIYSTKDNLSNDEIIKIIKNNFSKTHGSIKVNNSINKFLISPHISNDKSNQYILMGDTLRSIHPVAGQGWNLGIKDIQTLNKTLDSTSLKNANFIKKYHSQRTIESLTYIAFTSSINFLYENQNPLSNFTKKFFFNSLKNFSPLRNTFIKIAMGRLKLI